MQLIRWCSSLWGLWMVESHEEYWKSFSCSVCFFLFWGWCLNGRSSQVIKPHTFNFYLQCMYLHFKTHICPHFFFWQCKNYNFWVTIIGFSLTIFLVHLLKKKKGKKFVIDLCCTEGTYCSEILWLLLLNLFSFPLPSPPRSSWGFPEFCIALGG